MSNFVFSGGTLTEAVSLTTNCIGGENPSERFFISTIGTDSRGVASGFPDVADADLKALLSTIKVGKTTFSDLKTFAKSQSLTLTRIGGGVLEVVVGQVLSALAVDKVLFQSGTTVRYIIEGDKDISMIPSKGISKLECKGNGEAANNGTFTITAFSNGTPGIADSKYIEVDNPSRTDKNADEGTGAPGTCNVIAE